MIPRFARMMASLLVVGVLALAAALPAHALQFVLTGSDFSGATSNTGGEIIINITNIAGGVQVQIINNLDTGFISEVSLNTSVSPLAGTTSFSCVNCAAVPDLNVSFGDDAFKADGDGWYDIFVDLATPGPPNDRLDPGEQITFNILSTTAGFSANSFVSLSENGGHGPFFAAAHVQGLGAPDGSDWLGVVPEPGSLLLLGSGLAALGAAVRRRRRASARSMASGAGAS